MKNFKNFIFNKITLTVLGVFLLSLVSYGIFYYFQQKKRVEEKKSEIVKVSLVDDLHKNDFLDTDGDGVYDWLEEKYPELDPNNPDSDGDGVSDGKYLQQKQLIREKDRLGENGSESTFTESDKLGRSVYMALVAAKNSGGLIDEQTEDQISQNIANYIKDLSIGTKLYTRDELNLVSDTQKNSYDYKKIMISLFKEYPINTSEINLIINATEKPEVYTQEIEKATIKYNKYFNKLSTIKVPYIIAGRHVEFLNAVGQLEGALKNLNLKDSDDLVSLASLVQIKKTLDSIVDASTHIEKYFDIISDPAIFNDKISSE